MCVMIAGACLLNAALLSFDAGYTTEMDNTRAWTLGGPGNFDVITVTDISHKEFYRDEQTNWNAKIGLFFRGGTFVAVGYDSGRDTKKFDVSKRYDIDIKQKLNLSPNSSIVLGAGTSFGGKERHSTCTVFGVESFCPHEGYTVADINKPHKQPYNLSLKYSYKF